MESLDADMKALEAVGVRADKAAAAKEKLEADLEKAEENNDLAAQKFLKEQIKILTLVNKYVNNELSIFFQGDSLMVEFIDEKEENEDDVLASSI